MSTLVYKVARSGKEFTEVDETGLRDGLSSGRILASDHCWTGGFSSWQRVDAVVAQLGATRQSAAVSPSAPAQAKPKAASAQMSMPASPQAASPGSLIPHLWGALAVAIALWAAQAFLYSPQWEYLAIRVLTSRQSDRNGIQAMWYSSIDSENLVAQLRAMGDEGWEVTGVSLEMETAWPNFGRDDYVTGLQPNIRPQSMLVILKRKRSFF